MVLTGKRHPFLARWKAGFTLGGVIEALQLELYSDGGWSLDLSAPILARAMFHVDNCYLLRNVEVLGRVLVRIRIRACRSTPNACPIPTTVSTW